MSYSYLKYLPIILPSVMGYGAAMFCNVSKSSGSTVNFRPPPVVFSVVWIILYILIGVSWFITRSIENIDNQTLITDIFFLILNVLLISWIIFYSCKNDKKNAIYVLVLSIMMAIFCYTIGDITGKLLITPLICWLFLATLINVFEVA